MIKNKPLVNIDKKALPEKVTLPFNGSVVTEKSFSFSFSCFDRTHELFNLGDSTPDNVVSGKWFLDYLDCLKSVCNMTMYEVQTSSFDLHPIDWEKTNTHAPEEDTQREYWQFRINKSRGRIIGFIIEGVFYIVWLDPHHNLTDSEGYGGVRTYRRPCSEYEELQYSLQLLQDENKRLSDENKAFEDLFKEAANKE